MIAEAVSTEEGADDDVVIFEPDFSLKQRIGVDVSITELLQPEILAQAQGIVDLQRPAFIQSIKDDVYAIRELLEQLEQTTWDAKLLEQFMQRVLQVKGRAGTFGLPLATEIARRLYVFCEDEYRAKADHMMVLRKHVDGIAVVVNQNIEGAGGALGKELLDSLSQLAAKLK